MVNQEKLKKILTVIFTVFFLLLFAFIGVGSCGGIKYLIDNHRKTSSTEVQKVYADELDVNYQSLTIDLSSLVYSISLSTVKRCVNPLSSLTVNFIPFTNKILFEHYTLSSTDNLVSFGIEIPIELTDSVYISVAGINYRTNYDYQSLTNINLLFELDSINYFDNNYVNNHDNFEYLLSASIYYTSLDDFFSLKFIFSNAEVIYKVSARLIYQNVMYECYLDTTGGTYSSTVYTIIGNDFISNIINERLDLVNENYLDNLLDDIREQATADATSDFNHNYSASEKFKWRNFFSAFFDSPLAFFNTLVTFDFFGYNLIGVYRFLVSLCFVLLIFRFFI